MIYNTSIVLEEWDLKLLVEQLCDRGAMVEIREIEQ